MIDADVKGLMRGRNASQLDCKHYELPAGACDIRHPLNSPIDNYQRSQVGRKLA